MNYMRLKDVAQYMSVSTDTINRWIRDYGFPHPVKIGGNNPQSCSIWSQEMVDNWFRDKLHEQITANKPRTLIK